MRAIKFRGMRLDNGEWVYGYLIGTNVIVGEIVEWDSEYFCTEFWYKVDPETVGQYTGLTDCKGVEIYEGSIIQQTYHVERGSVHDGTDESFDGHHIGEVAITASQGVCMRKPLCWSMETDETNRSNQYKKVAGYRSVVIGTIYANPEILEGL